MGVRRHAQFPPATVCGMTTAAMLKYGVGSFEFAVSFVVNHGCRLDAIGVRRETGKQAEASQPILNENPAETEAERGGVSGSLRSMWDIRLFQVMAGAILWNFAGPGNESLL